MKILIASTIAPWKQGQGTIAWLANAEAMVEHYGKDHEIEFFLGREVDGRGGKPYFLLSERIARLRERGFTFTIWNFVIDDGAKEFESGNRLFRICTGRNAAHEFAMVNGFDAILFLDTDILPDADCIPKLLEIEHPIVGGNVGAYCMTGPEVPPGHYGLRVEPEDFFGTVPEGAEVQQHWNTAGFLLVRRKVFTNLAWHYNLDTGCTDDPTFQGDAVKLGFGQTWVRHDVNGSHVEPLVPVEARDADRTYYR